MFMSCPLSNLLRKNYGMGEHGTQEGTFIVLSSENLNSRNSRQRTRTKQ